MNYLEQSKEVFLHAYGRYDITMDHGKGVYLYDVNGKEYLDFYSGIGVNSFGHAYPLYVEKMQEQLTKVMHVSNYFNTVVSIDAAKVVCETIGMDKIFFTNSGTEATEGALKLARKYYYLKHQKTDSEIISFHQSFHGRSTGALRLTGNEGYQKAFGPLIDGVHHAILNDIESVKTLINERTCAIILEPVQGEGGLTVCKKEFILELRQLCTDHDIVFIFDEVQSGMGRTGTIMTYKQFDITPDIVCMAKGLGAGFPVGAFAANGAIADALQPGDHGTTYGGNPMAGMAVKTVFEILEKENLVEHVALIGKYLEQELNKLVEKYDCIVERRGLGLMQGLVFDHPVGDYIKKAQAKGLIFVSAGANVIRLLPPFIIEEAHVDQFVSILEEIMKEA